MKNQNKLICSLICLAELVLFSSNSLHAQSLEALTISPDGTLYVAGSQGYVAKITDGADKYSSRFYYDQVGRMVLSQNSKQYNQSKAESKNLYSYTLYDALGRAYEAGQVNLPQSIENASTTQGDLLVLGQVRYNQLQTLVEQSPRTEVTKTYYDQAPFSLSPSTYSPENLRLRVASVAYYPTYNSSAEANNYSHATHYSYDIHGNVKTLIQDNPGLKTLNHQYKRVDYQYDLISNKVNQVSYQKGQPDQYHHRYTYDADNRLIKVETSNNGIEWDRDASYKYYRHGPQARVELGQEQVQGMDYVYTLQGWIKDMNTVALNPNADPGQDGNNSNTDKKAVARDAFGYNLEYYGSDYQSINTPGTGLETLLPTVVKTQGQRTRDLYNGNISAMSTTITDKSTSTPKPQRAAYRYDQLNRLVEMQTSQNLTNNQWQSGSKQSNGKTPYEEHYSYDANGNILTLNRQSATGDMDQLKYIYENTANHYDKNTNRLRQVIDTVGDNVSSIDIDTQGANNYSYDALGNLVQDKSQGIDQISWTLSGKVKEIDKSQGPVSKITFEYDALGNRVSKRVEYTSSLKPAITTYYVRDASGNLMATYEQTGNKLTLSEQYIYGSQRLGYYKADKELSTDAAAGSTADYYTASTCVGCKRYELTNHLGNVVTVISDKKIPHSIDNNGNVDYYTADIISTTDYYPGGMIMPNRNYNSDLYRFGYNKGSEKDDEIAGSGDHFTTLYREGDTRLLRWWSLDPKGDEQAEQTPYSYMDGNPVKNNDEKGDQTFELEVFKYAIGTAVGGSYAATQHANVSSSILDNRFTRAVGKTISQLNHPDETLIKGLVLLSNVVRDSPNKPNYAPGTGTIIVNGVPIGVQEKHTRSENNNTTSRGVPNNNLGNNDDGGKDPLDPKIVKGGIAAIGATVVKLLINNKETVKGEGDAQPQGTLSFKRKSDARHSGPWRDKYIFPSDQKNKEFVKNKN